MNTTHDRLPLSLRIALPALVIVAALTAGLAAAQGASGERLRLVLDDATIDVIGPVQRDGALLTFRTLDGQLGSIQVRRVVRMISLASGRSAPPPAAPAPDASAAVPQDRAARYSNDNLPPAAAPFVGALSNDDLADDVVAPVVTRGSAWTNADLPPGAEPDEGESAAPDASADAPANDVAADAPAAERAALDDVLARLETPGRAGAAAAPAPAPAAPGLDPVAVEIELAAIEEQIAAAEREENTYYRLMVCVQNGVSPRSPACNPTLRPRPSPNPSVTERSLAAKVSDARQRVEAAQDERIGLIERARAAGIELDKPQTP